MALGKDKAVKNLAIDNKRKKDEKNPHIIVLITNDSIFSYMFGMALRISDYDNLSIYDPQSNWLEDISKNCVPTLVLIDTESMGFDKCVNLYEHIILLLWKKRNSFGDNDDDGNDDNDNNNCGKCTQIRFCFLVSDKSIHAMYLNRLKANARMDAATAALPCNDIVERPFTIAEVADTVNSQMLHLCA